MDDETWAGLDDFEDATQVSESAPLVDFGNTPAELTAETRETDMSTMPETRNAALEVLRREVEDRRGRRIPRDGSAPLRRSATSQDRREPRASAPEVLPPRRPDESQASAPAPECGSIWRTTLSGPAGWRVKAILETFPEQVEIVAYDGTVRRVVPIAEFHRDYRFDEAAPAPEPLPPRRPDESRSQASKPVGDMKAGLTSSRPKLSIVPAAGELYQCRAMEYGADKYRRGNYHGTPPEGVAPAARVMGYVDAAMRHLRAVADAYNREAAVAQGPASLTFADAIACPDTITSGGFPASGLPHLAHAMASVSLAVQCGVDDSLLPADPGQPWKHDAAPADDRSPEAVARFGGAK